VILKLFFYLTFVVLFLSKGKKMKSKKIIILDDHTLFLRGMTLILKECCTDCEVFAYQSIRMLKKDKLNYKDFDLFISDVELPGEDTFGLLETLREKIPSLPILVVSMHKKNAVIRHCKDIGINGYLLKDEYEQLFKAIEAIMAGGEYYSNTIMEFCKKTKDIYVDISSREEQIIKLIAKGLNNNVIAQRLSLSRETVKTHKRNIKLKLDVSNTAEIIQYAKKTYLM
jgi:DNA-binding NarL/FixJ family response regulator